MINYNFRNRGTFEYDKFILNMLQLKNLNNHIALKQKNNGLNQYVDRVNTYYNNAKNNCESLYSTLVKYRR